MAKAIFRVAFNYTARKSKFGWAIEASPDPQSYPREVIAAAVEAGVAEVVPPRRRGQQGRVSPEQKGA